MKIWREFFDWVFRLGRRDEPAHRRYDRVTCPVCGRDVARSAVSPTRHKCKAKEGEA